MQDSGGKPQNYLEKWRLSEKKSEGVMGNLLQVRGGEHNRTRIPKPNPVAVNALEKKTAGDRQKEPQPRRNRMWLVRPLTRKEGGAVPKRVVMGNFRCLKREGGRIEVEISSSKAQS